MSEGDHCESTGHCRSDARHATATLAPATAIMDGATVTLVRTGAKESFKRRAITQPRKRSFKRFLYSIQRILATKQFFVLWSTALVRDFLPGFSHFRSRWDRSSRQIAAERVDGILSQLTAGQRLKPGATRAVCRGSAKVRFRPIGTKNRVPEPGRGAVSLSLELRRTVSVVFVRQRS